MTKETKIGLLVGLAFIILFAVILSEKGAPPRPTHMPAFALADGAKSAPRTPTGAEQPLHDAGRLPVDSQLPPIVRSGEAARPPAPGTELAEEQIAQVDADDNEPPPILPDGLASSLNLPEFESAGAAPAGSKVQAAKPSAPAPTPASVERPANKPALTVPPPIAEPKVADAASGQPRTPTPEPALSEAGEAPPQPPIKAPLVIKTVHVVQPGESLGKVAARYYGRSTPERVDAIFDANRDVLTDRHTVRANDKLKIPDLGLGEANALFEPVSGFPFGKPAKTAAATSDSAIRIPVAIEEPPVERGTSRPRETRRTGASAVQATATPAKPPTAQPAALFQWYQVRKNDTLSGIARRYLGGAVHIDQLYEINKDILSNRNKLRPGMKIRIPAKVSENRDPSSMLTISGSDLAEP